MEALSCGEAASASVGADPSASTASATTNHLPIPTKVAYTCGGVGRASKPAVLSQGAAGLDTLLAGWQCSNGSTQRQVQLGGNAWPPPTSSFRPLPTPTGSNRGQRRAGWACVRQLRPCDRRVGRARCGSRRRGRRRGQVDRLARRRQVRRPPARLAARTTHRPGSRRSGSPSMKPAKAVWVFGLYIHE